MWGWEGEVTWGQPSPAPGSCLPSGVRLLALRQSLRDTGWITWEGNQSILVNNSRINNYFTVVLSQAARISQPRVSHAPVASAPGVPLGGLGLFWALQPSVSDETVWGHQRTQPQKHIWMYEGLCKKGEGEWRPAVPPITEPTGDRPARWQRAPLLAISVCLETGRAAGAPGKVAGVRLHLFPSVPSDALLCLGGIAYFSRWITWDHCELGWDHQSWTDEQLTGMS